MASLNDIPSGILHEILYKLSPKQLHRNKIMCKLWSSLISHRSFRHKYLLQGSYPSSHDPITPYSFTIYIIFPDKWSKNSFNGEYLTYDAESKSWSKNTSGFSLEFLPSISPARQSHYNVLASSNGLLLCSKTYYHSKSGSFYFVCNPLTKKWFPLPSPPTRGLYSLWGIVCYPANSESESTRFKVVKIVSLNDENISNFVKMEIFESTTNEWKVLTPIVDVGTIIFDITKFNAFEHRGISYCSFRSHEIIAFDPNVDMCRRIYPTPGGSLYLSTVGASQDHLYYVNVHSLHVVIWRYNGYFEGEDRWSRHKTFNTDWIDQQKIHFQHVQNLRVLAIHPIDCNIVYLSSSDQVSCIRHIYSIDLERREMKELCSFPLHSGSSRCDDYDMRSLMFVQSCCWPTDVPEMPPAVTDSIGGQGGLKHPQVVRKRRKTK